MPSKTFKGFPATKIIRSVFVPSPCNHCTFHLYTINVPLTMIILLREEFMVLGHCEACLKSCYNTGKE